MKQPQIKKYVKYGKWITPLCKQIYYTIGLSGVLQTEHQIHFFFFLSETEETAVLTIPSASPFRILDENVAHSSVGKGLKDPNRNKKRRPKHQTTWKIFNTDYLKELKKTKKTFQYLVRTTEETVEFISPQPKWEIYQNIKAEKLIQKYIKIRFHQRFNDWKTKA